MRRIVCAVLALAASLLAACGGGVFGARAAPAAAASCPPPPAHPTPIPAFLDYPPSGSTNVAIDVGEIIEKGAMGNGAGLGIGVSSPQGNVPVGAPTVAPSPYPSPFATPPPDFALSRMPYIAVPLPTLSPATTYAVYDYYTDWADNPPLCSAQYVQPVGTFSTQ